MHNHKTAFYDGTAPQSALGDAQDLDRPSVDCLAMLPYWERVADIVAGADAIRLQKTKYLPKFEGESQASYDARLGLTKFTNIYRDIVENLAAKPFAEEITFVENSTVVIPEPIDEFIENVDGATNNITTFAGQLFFHAINDAVTWIFVDYPDMPTSETGVRSVADEQRAGLTPFWSIIRAMNVLEARSEMINGVETLTYVRLLERSGGETFVRVMQQLGDAAIWTLYKKRPAMGVATMTIWDVVKFGEFTIGVIPLIPIVIGRRDGRTYQVAPPMRDAADLQLELYWQESSLKFAKAMSAFPMIAGNGVSPMKDAAGNIIPLKLSPMTALYAPPSGNGTSGSWQLLEPSSSSLTFLQSDVKETVLQLRELGRQPLTAQSGNLTVITAAVAAAKGNSAAQQWALIMQDGLDKAVLVTALWMGIAADLMTDVKLKVFTDFEIDSAPAEQLTTLTDMRKNRDISQRTYWAENKRRGVLSPDFDPESEEQALLDEGPSDSGTSDPTLDPTTGRTFGNTMPAA